MLVIKYILNEAWQGYRIWKHFNFCVTTPGNDRMYNGYSKIIINWRLLIKDTFYSFIWTLHVVSPLRRLCSLTNKMKKNKKLVNFRLKIHQEQCNPHRDIDNWYDYIREKLSVFALRNSMEFKSDFILKPLFMVWYGCVFFYGYCIQFAL